VHIIVSSQDGGQACCARGDGTRPCGPKGGGGESTIGVSSKGGISTRPSPNVLARLKKSQLEWMVRSPEAILPLDLAGCGSEGEPQQGEPKG